MFEPDDVTKPVETLPPSTGESREGAVMESGSDPMPEPDILAHAAADIHESGHAEERRADDVGHLHHYFISVEGYVLIAAVLS